MREERTVRRKIGRLKRAARNFHTLISYGDNIAEQLLTKVCFETIER